jgi:hypothetical protein
MPRARRAVTSNAAFRSGRSVRGLVFLLVALFGSALARAREVAGIGHRVPHENHASRQAEGPEPHFVHEAPVESATVGSSPE